MKNPIITAASASLVWALAFSPMAQAEEKPGMILHVQSIDALTSELSKVAAEWDFPIDTDTMIQGLGQALHIPNLEGVDRTRPIQVQFAIEGSVAELMQSGESPTIRVMLPLSDVATFKKQAGTGLESKGDKKGISFFKDANTGTGLAIRIDGNTAWLGQKRKHVATGELIALEGEAFGRMPGAWSIYLDVDVVHGLMKETFAEQKKMFADMEERTKQLHADNPELAPSPSEMESMQPMMYSQEKLMGLLLNQADYLLFGAELQGAPAIHTFIQAKAGSEMAAAIAAAPQASKLLRSLPVKDAVITSFGNMTGSQQFYGNYMKIYGDMMEGITEALGEQGAEMAASYKIIAAKAQQLYDGGYSSFVLQPTEAYALNTIGILEAKDANATLALIESLVGDYRDMIKAVATMDSNDPGLAAIEQSGFDIKLAGTSTHNGVDIRQWNIQVTLPDTSGDVASAANMKKLQDLIDSLQIHLAAIDGHVVMGMGDPAHVHAAIDHIKGGGNATAAEIAGAFGPLSNYARIDIGATMNMVQSLMTKFAGDDAQLPIPPMQGALEVMSASANGGAWATLRLTEDLVASIKQMMGAFMAPPPQSNPGQQQGLESDLF